MQALLITVLLTVAPIKLLAAGLQVEQITADNVEQTIQSGPDAIGGIGDWFLSNGVLCAVIADIDHETEFSTQGGVLVDLGYCDRADDHYTSAQDMLDGKRTRPVDIQQIRHEQDNDAVSIITLGEREGMQVETRYTLNATQPQQLHINKRVRVLDESQEGFNLYTPATFNYHSLQTFTFSSTDLTQSKGFENEEFVSRGVTSLKTAARNVDTIIAVGPADAVYPISYGWQLKSARRHSGESSYPVPHFALADDESMAMLVLVDDFYIGDGSQIGLLQLPQVALMSLDEEDELVLDEVIYVGRSADVAAITDQFFAAAPTVSGVSEVLDSVLHVDLPDGTPVTHVRTAEDGSFRFRIPPGDYRLRHLASADRSAEKSITVGEQGLQLGQMPMTDVATLGLPRGQAMRLIFVGLDGTENPDFVDTLTNFSVLDADGIHYAQEVNQVFLAGIDSDLAEVALAPGKYRVYATRGPEYSLESTELELQAGEQQQLVINSPQRLLSTPGYIAADFHVHAGYSFDNTYSSRERVRSFVAEHGEVMVNSEHDVSIDFAPLIAEMGVGEKITSISGIEMTSLIPTEKMPYTGGHVNFFPFSPKPHAYRRGMINHEDRRLRAVLHDVQQASPGAVSQLNHPRKNLSLSGELPDDYQDQIDAGAYFDHMGIAAHPYDPSQPIDSHPNNTLIQPHPQTGLRDIDVDAVELLNPGGEYHEERLQAVRKDWLSLQQQGIRITGTANSDSHHSGEQVAVPRNMVAVAGDSVAEFEVEELLAAVRSGNLYGTTGPMLDLSLSGASMGETYQGSSAILEVSISSVDWIPVERLNIQVNGQQVAELDVTRQRTFRVELEFSRDSFVTVEVLGTANSVYEVVYPGISPYAFSNPIYVDYNGDSSWQPPGLPQKDSSERPGITILPVASQDSTPNPTNGATTMPEHEKINYLEYAARDIDATKAFFSQVFGWEFEDYGPDYTAFSNQGVDGGFYRADLSSSVDKGAALTVFYSDELEATEQKVIAAGGEIIKPIFSFPGGRRFHFTEPSGNEFAVWALPEPE